MFKTIATVTALVTATVAASDPAHNNDTMLVMTVIANDMMQSVLLSENLSASECFDMMYLLENGLNNNAMLTCEITGDY